MPFSPSARRLAVAASHPATAARRLPPGHATPSLAVAPHPSASHRPAARAAASPLAAPAPPDSLLDETQAARLLRVSPRTLQGWRLKGGGPAFVKLGRAIRYRRADLQEFVVHGLRRSTSDPGPAAG